jgi:hypothetical protein
VRIARTLAAAGSIAFLLTACGGAHREAACQDGWVEGKQEVSVREAVEDRPSGVVSVEGALVFRDLETRLCAGLAPGGRCRQPSLAAVGLGNPLRALEGMTVEQADPPIGWMESVSIDGVAKDGELRVPLTCRSARVIDHFAEETGQRLHRDFFFSGGDADVLDFEAAPDPDIAAARRREWGLFGVRVMLAPQAALEWELEQLGPYVVELPTREPDADGIVWVRIEERGWLALKEYDRRHLLQWAAGDRRRVDDRWRRLDAILDGLA